MEFGELGAGPPRAEHLLNVSGAMLYLGADLGRGVTEHAEVENVVRCGIGFPREVFGGDGDNRLLNLFNRDDH